MATQTTIESTIEKPIEKVRLRKPSMYNVVMLNDDTTPMEFVIDVLTTIFHHDTVSASKIMMTIHTSGEDVAGGPYTNEVATMKIQEVKMAAANFGFQLQSRIEQA